MKKQTRIILIVAAVMIFTAAAWILFSSFMKIRCRIFLANMNNKTAVHTISQTENQQYHPDSGFVVTDTSTTQEWAYKYWVYRTTTSGSYTESELLNKGHFFNNAKYGWSQCSVSSHAIHPFWKFRTWESLSYFPSSVRISNGLIQVVFLESRIGTDNRRDYEHILQFNFLLQFDSYLYVTTSYSTTNAAPDSIVYRNTTRYQIVHFDESENLSVIEEQYALAKATD